MFFENVLRLCVHKAKQIFAKVSTQLLAPFGLANKPQTRLSAAGRLRLGVSQVHGALLRRVLERHLGPTLSN